MPKVTYSKTVSDAHVHVVLQRIADFFHRDISVHSGDRSFVPKGGSTKSLHLAHRAADFHVAALQDGEAFKTLKEGLGAVFDPGEGYELILHGPHTATGGPHLHVGHYQGKNKGLVLFKTEGLTPSTKGHYSVEPHEIHKGMPVAARRPPPMHRPVNPLPARAAPSHPHPSPTGDGAHLTASVGRGGKNVRADVILVQSLLNRARKGTHQGKPLSALYESLAEDGVCGPKTLRAIEQFQKRVAGLQVPDGRVDPGGRTLRLLGALHEDDSSHAPHGQPRQARPPPVQQKPIQQKPSPLPSPQASASGTSGFVKDKRTFSSRDGYPVYAQGDSAWGSVVLTPSSSNVSQIGCALTSVSMALSGITGRTITPEDMAKFMKEHELFDENGNLQNWNTMGELVSPAVGLARTMSGMNADKIDQELNAGRPVAIHVDYYSSTTVNGKKKKDYSEYDGKGDHWILVTGKRPDGKYQANDPAGGKMITLHRLADGRLQGDEATSHGSKYQTVGGGTTFSRGPAVHVADGSGGAATTPSATGGAKPADDSFKVPKGQLTFDAEGAEGGKWHSRKAHWPGGASGVTIGRGYDMKERDKDSIIEDLTAAGVPRSQATALAEGAGLTDDDARDFVKGAAVAKIEITAAAQKALFTKVYEEYLAIVKRISDKDDTVDAYGKVSWDKLKPAILDLAVDLAYRGDYRPDTRESVQELIVNNDLNGLSTLFSDEHKMVDKWHVPKDRFKRRKEYLKAAIEAEKAKKA